MRIAVFCPPFIPVNETAVAGGEVWAANFIQESVRKGHEIDLYAIKGSLNNPPHINLIEIADQGIEEREKSGFFKAQNENFFHKFISGIQIRADILIKEREKTYDLVIDSTGNFIGSMNWDLFSIPLIVIGHQPVDKNHIVLYKQFPLPKKVYFTFPSQFQSQKADFIPESHKFTIPHGIDIQKIVYQNEERKENMVWLGRVDRNSPKGLDIAIKLSGQVKHMLDAYIHISDESYYNQTIRPLIQANHVRVNENETDKLKIFSQSKLFILPLEWEEPFGLVIIESMATGTPVVAYARGAVPEIIKDGITGFIINPSDDDIRGDFIIKKTGIEGLREAVERMYAMPIDEYRTMRKNCRKRVEEHFTIEKMVDGYEKVYQTLNHLTI